VLLFGAKRIPEIAGSLGQGIQSFKKSMAPDDTPEPPAQMASNLNVPLPKVRTSNSPVMAQTDDVAREPKRLY
ncbi:MAG: twin-arginine translocase TatA/TatE family subunit, partial [Gemmatimonadaceae bacterium]